MKAIFIDLVPEVTKAQYEKLYEVLHGNSYKWDGNIGRYSNGTKVFTVIDKDEEEFDITITTSGDLT